MSSADYAARFRSLRKTIGWVLVVIWIWGWHWYLDGVRDELLSFCHDEGLWEKFWSWLWGCQDHANATMHWMVVVLLTAPSMFVLSKLAAESIVKAEMRAHEATRLEGIRAEQQELARVQDQQRQLLASNRLARLRNARSEVIQKLGSANDYLAILDHAPGASEAQLIRQELVQELRALVIKYPEAELAELLAGDEAIKQQLLALGEGLGRHGIRSPEAATMLSLPAVSALRAGQA